MVQIVRGGPSRSSMIADILGPSLGQGLGEFTGDYFASKALDKVKNDPSLAEAPQSERMSKLEAALRPYGNRGIKMLQSQMAFEQQRENEKQELKNKKRNIAENKFLSGKELSESEEALIRPEIRIAYAKATKPKEPLASEKPIPEDQLNKINEVRNIPNFGQMSETEQYRAFTNAGVSPVNAERESKLRSTELEREQKSFESSYKAQEDFINETTSSYKGFETEMKPRLLQMQKLASDKDLISPTASVFLDSLGIPLGALADPSSELFNKLSQDLLKGLPEVYGTRILKVEVENFLKTIPQLTNSPNGRRMIASNMLKLGELKEVYYNEMRREQKDYLDKNKTIPRDFQQRVFDQVKPQIDRLNNEFIKLADIKDVPKGSIPFFGPDGEISFVPKEHAQWASENGGRRIW
jgi:hypothetical protein